MNAHRVKLQEQRMKCIGLLVLLVSVLALLACGQTDASVVSHNISEAADNFEVNRRIVFYNGITDVYMLVIEGRCSIREDNYDDQLEVTCKHGPNAYNKHFLGLSDNVTYIAEQLEAIDVNVYHYRVTFKPQSIVPDVKFRGDAGDLVDAANPGDRR